MPNRREELLVAATAWVYEHGLGALSIRPLAKALGTSDRMLLYYFTTKDELVAAITTLAGTQLVAALPTVDTARPPRSARPWLDRVWARFTDPTARPALVLLFEFDVIAARTSGPARDAATAVSERWLDIVDEALATLRIPTRRRRALTPMVASTLIGLALDHVVTDTHEARTAIRSLAEVIDGARE